VFNDILEYRVKPREFPVIHDLIYDDAFAMSFQTMAQPRRTTGVHEMKTVTYNPATHKIVPIKPTENMHCSVALTLIMNGRDVNFPPRVYQALLAAAPEFSDPAWINVKDRLPSVRAGNCKEFIVHAKEKYSGKESVFSAMYLHKMVLENPYTGEEEENTSWNSAKEHHDYDGFYETLSSREVLHWMPLPDIPK
jgi:hypothetical protein